MLKTVVTSIKTHTQITRAAAIATAILTTTLSFGVVACPDLNATDNFPLSDVVNASALNSSGALLFSINSLDRNPVNGVPGVIELCVYPFTGESPSGVSVYADIDPGNENLVWQDSYKPKNGVFSFRRTHGNKSNVPLDSVIYWIGEATWFLNLVPEIELLVHINDPEECTGLYGKKTQTCWVHPKCEPDLFPNSSVDLCLPDTGN